MEKTTDTSDTAKNSGYVETKEDGTQYFVLGKNRIKITEHFAENGKTLETLLEELIMYAAKKSEWR